MSEKKRYILSDFFWEVLDTKYDWLGHTEPFTEQVLEEEDYLLIGCAKTQDDGEAICKVLNALTEKNEQLEKIISEICDVADKWESIDNAKLQNILWKMNYYG